MERCNDPVDKRRLLLFVSIFGVIVVLATLTALAGLDTTGWVNSLISGAIAATGLVVVIREGMLHGRAISEADEDPKEVLQRRVRRVNEAVAIASFEMQALQRDLEAQQAASAALLDQAKEQQSLLEINQDQAEKIRHILVGETKATLRAEGRKQWMFFGLGVVVSIPIGIMINILVP